MLKKICIILFIIVLLLDAFVFSFNNNYDKNIYVEKTQDKLNYDSFIVDRKNSNVIVNKKKIVKNVSFNSNDNESTEYEKYENLPNSVKDKVDVIPRKQDVSIDRIKGKVNDKIPSKFNLNDKYNLKVENQGFYGMCWGFASLNSLETYLMLHKDTQYDFSEMHLDYLSSNIFYGERELHGAGNFEDFQRYLSFSTPTLESEFKYLDYDSNRYSDLVNSKSLFKVTKTVDYPTIRKTNGKANISSKKLNDFRNVIKSHLINNGSLYAVIDSSSIDEDNGGNTYCDKDCNVDHAISIVGYDDNYSKDNFKINKPKHDGAYIALNSWGKQWHGGYFYISYDDALVEANMSGILSVSNSDAYLVSDIKNDFIRNTVLNKLFFSITDDKYIDDFSLSLVESLDLSSGNLSSLDLQYLSIFPNLKRVNLADNNITDLSYLKNVNLEEINLANNKVNTVENLSSFKKLKKLNLSGNSGVLGYDKISSLEDLDLSNCNLKVLKSLRKNNNLINLNLSNNNISIKGLINTKVKKLIMTNTNLNDFSTIKNLKNLEYLDVSSNPIVKMNGITSFKKLAYLNVSKTKINNFTKLNNLRKKYNTADNFSLVYNSSNLFDISIFNDLNVNSLDLSFNNINTVENFNNKYVSSLNLSHNKGIKGFEKLEVSDLNISVCDIDDLSSFSNLNNLVSLDLSNNNIGDISILNKFTNLKNLNLANTKAYGVLNMPLSLINLDNCDLNNISFKSDFISALNGNFKDIKNVSKGLKNVSFSPSDFNLILESDYKISSSYVNINSSFVSFNDYWWLKVLCIKYDFVIKGGYIKSDGIVKSSDKTFVYVYDNDELFATIVIS